MTSKKSLKLAGRRPDVPECLEAWWRVADSPAGQVFPGDLRGRQDDKVNLCNAFDLYCWQLVGRAFVACKTRGVPPTKLAKLAAHIQSGGKFSTFQLHDTIQLDPEDPKGWRSIARPVSELDRIGVDDSWIARAAYAKFKKALEVVIQSADPFLPPARNQSA